MASGTADLVTPVPMVAIRRTARLVQAYLLLLQVHRTLRTGGFKAAKPIYLRPWRKGHQEIPADAALVHEVEWAVETACAWQWQRTVCLHRAITAYCLLRTGGARPIFITGVTTRPFASHAWVEIGGCPIADTEMKEVRYHYKPMLTIPDVSRLTPLSTTTQPIPS